MFPEGAPSNGKKVAWPSLEEWNRIQAACGSPLQDMMEDRVRAVRQAFERGCDYVSLQSHGREVGRIYRDGRSWTAPIVDSRKEDRAASAG